MAAWRRARVATALAALALMLAPVVRASAGPVRPDVPTLPEAGTHWRAATTRGALHVWVPDQYDRATALTIVFVHGYNTDVDTAWTDYHLEQQFAHSGLNAMFIACAAPAAPDRAIIWDSLEGLLSAVVAETGLALPTNELVVVGHSGAYRTLAPWLADRALHTVVLLDAAYGEQDDIVAWARDPAHRLVDLVSDTVAGSEWIHAFLPDTMRISGLPSIWTHAARAARVLYVRTQIGHMPLITGGVALPMALDVLAKRAAW